MTHDPRRWLLVVGVALWAWPARAYDYAGRLNLGVYEARENLTVPSSGSTTNDAMLGLGTAYLDVAQIGSKGLEFTFDFRDKYDSFGKVDPTQARLIESNDPQLRQLVLKSPPSSGTIFWSIGRFAAADASVLDNDGAELGYRLTSKLRMSVFGGLYPEQRGERSFKFNEEDHQLGAYAVYEDLSRNGLHNTYASSSFVVRQAVPNVESYDNPAAPLAGSTLRGQPETLPTDHPTGNYLFWYANAVMQRDNGLRFTYLSHVDIEPSVHVRNLWASVFDPLTNQLSGSLNLMRLDLTEYERQRDLLDPLPPSAYTQGGGDLRWKFTRQYEAVVEAFYGLRQLDSKDQFGGNAKLITTGLWHNHLMAFVGDGYRKNFLSHDLTGRAGSTYYTTNMEIATTAQYSIQNRSGGLVLHPLIVDIEASSLLSRQLLGSFMIESARDEQASVLSLLLTLGYRFNNRQLDPIRDRAPPLERLL